MFWKTILVGDNERVLITRNGRFESILAPGRYRIYGPAWRIRVETFPLTDVEFTGEWVNFLVRERPAVVREYFVLVETRDDEVAVVYADGKLIRVLGPAQRRLYWNTPVVITFDVFNVDLDPEVPAAKVDAVARLGGQSQATFAAVEEGKTGLLFIDNKLVRTLAAGNYGFWIAAGAPRVEVVDLRWQVLEIPGQEILTRDKVPIRVNVAAEVRIADAVKARQAAKDATAHLYRVLQLAIRRSLGTKTLEEILAEKTDVDGAVLDEVRRWAETVGLQINGLALRDIVLPGEIREILNQVVAAEKQAQANLIRRREETAATRSLLNTARLLEENPILVRLKELETLEKLTEKVDRITVAGGFNGLLNQLLTEIPKQ